MQAPPKKLLDQVRDTIRLKHYSYRTEETYVQWSRRFILSAPFKNYWGIKMSKLPWSIPMSSTGVAEVFAALSMLEQPSTREENLSALVWKPWRIGFWCDRYREAAGLGESKRAYRGREGRSPPTICHYHGLTRTRVCPYSCQLRLCHDSAVEQPVSLQKTSTAQCCSKQHWAANPQLCLGSMEANTRF